VRPVAIDHRVYSPFPVAGLAAWTDTWGAPRYAGGYHPHHGQDLMCTEGTPLLAVEAGTVQLNSDPLGGITVFLVRPNGSFWYYAHLSRYANGIVDGAHVLTGQRIGRCGATGDATVSHLHFSLYTASGRARNPMRFLIDWLHDAERSSGLRPSTGNGVRLPKRFTRQGDAGEEPVDVVPEEHPTQVATALPGVAANTATPELPVTSGPTRAVLGVPIAAIVLLLGFSLLHPRVRAGFGQLRRASRSP
jgi:murein DD-endopeptidase MepM/ murein hydrolase activator NlpD